MFDQPMQTSEHHPVHKSTDRAPINCHRCQVAHSSCDRSLPTCRRCERLGIDCAYSTPKKRGRKPSSEKLKQASLKRKVKGGAVDHDDAPEESEQVDVVGEVGAVFPLADCLRRSKRQRMLGRPDCLEVRANDRRRDIGDNGSCSELLHAHVKLEHSAAVFGRSAPDTPDLTSTSAAFDDFVRSIVIDDGNMLFNNPFDAQVQPLDVWDDAFFEEEGNRDFLNNSMRYLADGEAWSATDQSRFPVKEEEEVVPESSCNSSGNATPVEEVYTDDQAFRPILFDLDLFSFSNPSCEVA